MMIRHRHKLPVWRYNWYNSRGSPRVPAVVLPTPLSSSVVVVGRRKLYGHVQHYQQPEKHRDCNRRYDGILKIAEADPSCGGCSSSEKGLGLYASKNFAIGDFVMASRPIKVTGARDSHTIQIGWDRHVIMDLPAVLINHSCDANVGIRNNDDGAYDFWAIRPIAAGEELTWDYETAEWDISVPFRCGCGSPNCRGTLRGFKSSETIIRNRYGEHYADYLK